MSYLFFSLWVLALFEPTLSQPQLDPGKSVNGEISSQDPIIQTPLLQKTFASKIAARGDRFQLTPQVSGPYFVRLRSAAIKPYLIVRDLGAQTCGNWKKSATTRLGSQNARPAKKGPGLPRTSRDHHGRSIRPRAPRNGSRFAFPGEYYKGCPRPRRFPFRL